MPTKCRLLGELVSSAGAPIPLARVTFTPKDGAIRPLPPLTIVPEVETGRTDESGHLLALDGGPFEVYPGVYSIRVKQGLHPAYPTMTGTVPEAETAVLSDIQNLAPPVPLNDAQLAVLAAQQARDQAREAAGDAAADAVPAAIAAVDEALSAKVQAAQDAQAAAEGAAGAAAADAVAQAVPGAIAAVDEVLAEKVAAAEQAREGAETAAGAAAAEAAAEVGALLDGKVTAAEEARSGAAGSAGIATTQASLASAAKMAAEAARDAAIAAGAVVGTYASTAIGLAAVSEGAKFWAPSADGKILQQYTKTSGAAVAVSGVAVPTALAIEDVNQVIAPAAGRIIPLGSEILWRTTAAIPAGWYDTTERLSLGSEIRAVLSNIFDPSLYDVVSVLTDPTLPSNLGRTVVLLTDPVIPARCDGTRWINVATGEEITLWWLPGGAALHVDFINGRFYWGGAVRSIADLTAVSGGAYYISGNPVGFTDTAIVSLDMSQDQANDMAGTVFSWTSGYPTGNRVEFVRNGNATYGDNLRVYVSPSLPVADFDGLPTSSKAGEGGAVYIGDGIWRWTTRIKSGALNQGQCDNGEWRNLTKTSGTLGTPTKVGFACRAWAPSGADDVLTDATLRQVTVWNSDLTEAHRDAIGASTLFNYRPIHFLGDSFLNNYQPYSKFRELLAPYGYIPLSQDGVGGTTLTQQLVRLAAGPAKWRDASLVLCEFGWDDDEATALANLIELEEILGHDRFIVMEPAPNENDGTPGRATWDAKVAAIAAHCGSKFVPTLEAAMALSTGSAQDVAKVAARRWPTSLTLSDTDFHPNYPAGAAFVASRILYGVRQQGWIPASYP